MDNTVFQIVDANLNRAREGLRVVEEIARFIFHDKKLTKKIKLQRHNLTEIFKDLSLLDYRDTSKDLGRDRNFDNVPQIKSAPKKGQTHRFASTKKELSDIAKRNLKRAQEGCRAMEEFGKLLNEDIPVAVKEIRFTIYDIEKEVDMKIAEVGNR